MIVDLAGAILQCLKGYLLFMTLIESFQKHRGYKCEAVCYVCLCVSWSCFY